MQETLENNKLGKEAKQLLKADEAFTETINASRFIKKAVTESTLKKPTQAGKVARGLRIGGDTSTREAINVLRAGGKKANKEVTAALGALNRFNFIVDASRIAGKVTNYTILGGVAGSIGAKSAQRFTGGEQ